MAHVIILKSQNKTKQTILLCHFLWKIQHFSETDDVDSGLLSSETILRGVTGREVLEELQVSHCVFDFQQFVNSGVDSSLSNLSTS